jgi:RNA polymerase sigma-70 factor (ECF subfamily)
VGATGRPQRCGCAGARQRAVRARLGRSAPLPRSGRRQRGPWLYGIARNLLAAHRRDGRIDARARRRLGIPSSAAADPHEAVDERIDASTSRPALERALQLLPAGQRDAVRLRVVDGLEYSEIARRLSCTETAARKRVSLGLHFLRSEMEAVR